MSNKDNQTVWNKRRNFQQSQGYGLLIPIVTDWIGRTSYRLSIIHYYMLGSNQATRLPNHKQWSGGKIGKQTITLQIKEQELWWSVTLIIAKSASYVNDIGQT